MYGNGWKWKKKKKKIMTSQRPTYLYIKINNEWSEVKKNWFFKQKKTFFSI